MTHRYNTPQANLDITQITPTFVYIIYTIFPTGSISLWKKLGFYATLLRENKKGRNSTNAAFS